MKYTFYIFIITIFSIVQLTAQTEMCGQFSTPEQIKYLKKTAEERELYDKSINSKSSASFTWVPVKLHNFLDDAGTDDGFGSYYFNTSMELLNEAFYSENIQFFECTHFSTYNLTSLYNYDISEEFILNSYDIPNVINIYYFGTVAGYCGYSYLPPSTDKIILNKEFGCSPANTLIHEMGHYLSLYHTHGKSNTTLTDEFVDGSNCTFAGDDICDTPADPNMLGQVGSNCFYSPIIYDGHGDQFVPDVTNFMSYAWHDCRNSFSQGQRNRMHYSLDNDRAYLTGCSHPGQCETPIDVFPKSFGFENSLDGWWYGYFSTAENLEHVPYSGPSPNPTYGPSNALQGNYYLTIDGSNNAIDRIFALQSPCIDISALIAPQISINYYSTGATYSELLMQISTDGGYNWNDHPIPFYVSGDQGNNWVNQVVDLTPFKNEEILLLRLIGIIYATEISDISFDDFVISDASTSCNLAGSMLKTDVACYGENSGNASVSISGNYAPPLQYSWNNGQTTASINNLIAGQYEVIVTDNNGCIYIDNLLVTEPQDLNSSAIIINENNALSNGEIQVSTFGGTVPYVYNWSNSLTTSTINNLVSGNYDLTITDANSCVLTNSYNIINQVICSQTLNSFPYNLNFETGLDIFSQSSNDDFDWDERSGSTPTSGTGPSSAKNGSKYYYTEATGNSPYKTAVLETNVCLDISNLNNPIFDIWYHMKGTQMGTFKIDISSDNGATWSNEFTKSGAQGNSWKRIIIDLIPYKTSTVKVRISGTTGNGQKSDMAIDRCFIGENPNPDFFTNFINEETASDEVLLYPNPTTNEFKIFLQNPDLEFKSIEIYNSLGIKVYSQNKIVHGNTIQLNELAPGNYFVKLINEQSEVIVKRIVLIK